MSKYNAEKQKYVQVLNEALKPIVEFGRVEYLNEHTKGTEYIKYTDAMGSARFLDVTSLDEEAIFIRVVSLVTGNEPSGVIKDTARLIAIARLFDKRIS